MNHTLFVFAFYLNTVMRICVVDLIEIQTLKISFVYCTLNFIEFDRYVQFFFSVIVFGTKLTFYV